MRRRRPACVSLSSFADTGDVLPMLVVLMAMISSAGCDPQMPGALDVIADMGESGQSLPEATEFILYTNPSDSLVLKAFTAEGSVFEVYGEKDAEGLATRLTGIKCQLPDLAGTNEGIWLLYDDNSRLREIVSDDGTEIRFDWQGETEAIIAIVFADGSIGEEVLYDFAGTSPAHSAKGESILARRTPGTESYGGTTVGTAFDGEAVQSWPRQQKVDLSMAAWATDTSPVLVAVSQCGEPVDGADVSVHVLSEDPIFRRTYRAKPTGTLGLYTASLPTDASTPGVRTNEICQSVSSFLHLCFAVEAQMILCEILAAAFETRAPVVSEVCQRVFRAHEEYCDTFEDLSCNDLGEFIDTHWPELIQLQARARIPGKAWYDGEVIDARVTGPYPLLTVSADALDIVNELPTGSIANKRPTIGAHVLMCASDANINLSSIEMTVDGSPVAFTVTGDNPEFPHVSYTPSADLITGGHTVSLSATLEDGTTETKKTWSFTIGEDNCEQLIQLALNYQSEQEALVADYMSHYPNATVAQGEAFSAQVTGLQCQMMHIFKELVAKGCTLSDPATLALAEQMLVVMEQNLCE
ncbi:MAG: hypothetical protein KAV82_12670 [Phycisphaerae bacterium]|nr:hypothetical protein [Phycisphaerae bacterium]